MSKMPSTRFPFISLSKALARAEKAFNADKNGKGLSMPVAFSAWGYSDKSSGGFQTVGALRGYGLLEADNSKEGKTLRLTEKARRYFHTEIEDDKAALRAEFAAVPSLFAHLLDRWDHDTVEDAVARTYLKTEIGLNDHSARAALGIYKDNLSFAARKASDKVTEPELTEDGGAVNEDAEVQEEQHQQARRDRQPAMEVVAEGPGLNIVRYGEGYVIYLGGSVMTQAHADEVITLLTALKASLPAQETKALEPPVN